MWLGKLEKIKKEQKGWFYHLSLLYRYEGSLRKLSSRLCLGWVRFPSSLSAERRCLSPSLFPPSLKSPFFLFLSPTFISGVGQVRGVMDEWAVPLIERFSSAKDTLRRQMHASACVCICNQQMYHHNAVFFSSLYFSVCQLAASGNLELHLL